MIMLRTEYFKPQIVEPNCLFNIHPLVFSCIP